MQIYSVNLFVYFCVPCHDADDDVTNMEESHVRKFGLILDHFSFLLT